MYLTWVFHHKSPFLSEFKVLSPVICTAVKCVNSAIAVICSVGVCVYVYRRGGLVESGNGLIWLVSVELGTIRSAERTGYRLVCFGGGI